MAASSILGPDGQPIKRAALTTPQAEPEITGTRSVWHEPVASGLTPQRLASILRQAAEGEMHDFLVLAEEIEEREAHYYSVLSTRRRAISELAPVITAATEEKPDVEIADKVRELVSNPRFALMVSDLTDALGKGFCAVEIMWALTGNRWWPGRYERRDPTFFRFDRRTGAELRLISPTYPDGEPLNPFTFIVHYPGLKSGIPARGGLARLAVWSFMLKAFSLKDWMAFLEVYGMPVRVGKYGPGATQAEKDALLRAVRDIAGDAAAIIPSSMMLEFIESKSDKGAEAFEKSARYLDEQMSKIVLGQTTTTDAISGGHAVSKEHNEVRHDILRFDARMLAATIQRDLIEPAVAFNFGPQERYPLLSFPVVEPEDRKQLIDVVDKFVRLGGAVSMAEVRDRIGFEEPAPDEPLLSAPRAEPKIPGAEDHDGEHGERATARSRLLPALAHAAEADHLIDEIMADALGDWEAITDPLLAPIRAAVEAASDYEDLRARLGDALSKMDSAALVEALARATSKARGVGAVKD